MTDKHRKKSKVEKLDATLSDRLAASDAAVGSTVARQRWPHRR